MGWGALGLPCLPGLVRLLGAAGLVNIAMLQHFTKTDVRFSRVQSPLGGTKCEFAVFARLVALVNFVDLHIASQTDCASPAVTTLIQLDNPSIPSLNA